MPTSLPIAWPARASTSCVWAISTPRTGPIAACSTTRATTPKKFDPIALARLDHLIAALKARGIYVALELASKRRFRAEDGVALPGLLPSGGGPAAMFDPKIGELALASAKALLGHVIPETGLALKEDPALAWVTLAGEMSMFDLIDNPDALPAPYAKALHELGARAQGNAGHRFWESIESAHLKKMADALRKDGLRVPMAGVSHWRREPEFCAAQAAPGLDLIDDRLFWGPSPWVSPEIRSMLWSPPARGLEASANHEASRRPSLRSGPVVQPEHAGVVVPARGGRPDAGRLHRDDCGLGCASSVAGFSSSRWSGARARPEPRAAKTSFRSPR